MKAYSVELEIISRLVVSIEAESEAEALERAEGSVDDLDEAEIVLVTPVSAELEDAGL